MEKWKKENMNNTKKNTNNNRINKTTWIKLITFLVAILIIGVIILSIDSSDIRSVEKNIRYDKGVVEKIRRQKEYVEVRKFCR